MNAQIEDRNYHEQFMCEAIEMAEQAFGTDETPVGCVFVHNGIVIGRGVNNTNKSLNGTRHCEFMALTSLLQTHPQSILRSTDLYVTVEPCIMCASALRQYRVRNVYFGCANARFGGTGGVLNIHTDPANIPPYKVYGGLSGNEAIMKLRRFYQQENSKAPNPNSKKGRVLKTDILPHQTSAMPIADVNELESKVNGAVLEMNDENGEVPQIDGDISEVLQSNGENCEIPQINGANGEVPQMNDETLQMVNDDGVSTEILFVPDREERED